MTMTKRKVPIGARLDPKDMVWLRRFGQPFSTQLRNDLAALRHITKDSLQKLSEMDSADLQAFYSAVRQLPENVLDEHLDYVSVMAAAKLPPEQASRLAMLPLAWVCGLVHLVKLAEGRDMTASEALEQALAVHSDEGRR